MPYEPRVLVRRVDEHRLARALRRSDGFLNPGVLINSDPRAHVTHLKSLPTVDPEVDRCIECGFCEPSCPSRRLTLTPRQRIAVRREMVRQEAQLERRLA